MPDIDLMGATYPDVPAVTLPSGDGTATFYHPDEIDYAASPTSGGNAVKANGILYAAVDSTSTSTAFTATVDGLTALYDGVAIMLRNGVVTSASGWTLNVNGLGAKPVYSNMADTTRETTLFNTNYTMLFVYDSDRIEGGCWMLYRGYYSDANSIGYQLRTNSSTLPAQVKFYRYRLLFTSADGTHWVPANTSTSTSADTEKTPNSTTPIDPLGPISYYGTTSAVNANANVGSGYQWQQYAINLGYSFNATSAALTLDYPKPVYVKCHPRADGSATIDATTPYTQALPSTADGCIYIYLGRAYSSTGVELVASHPVYWHDGTGIRLWTGAESIVANGSVTTAKLADYAVISNKLAPGAVTRNEISISLYNELSSIDYVAADATTQAVMANAGKTAVTLAPNAFVNSGESDNSRTRLCWFTMANGLEIASIGYAADLQGVLTFYARGLHTMASGTMNDTSWTITALPTDADGVSY